MSSSSKPKLSASNLKLFLQLAKHRRAQASRDGAIHYNIRLNQLIGSPAYPQDELALRKQATLGVDRAHNPQGFNRQLAAITASDCRATFNAENKSPNPRHTWQFRPCHANSRWKANRSPNQEG